MCDVLQISLKILNYPLINFGKATGIRSTFVPHKQHPSMWPQNSLKFSSGFCAVKPMESLACNDKINTCQGDSSCFGCPVDALKIGLIGKQCFGGQSHRGIWFDRHDRVAVLNIQFAQKAGPRADVCNDMLGTQGKLVTAEMQ